MVSAAITTALAWFAKQGLSLLLGALVEFGRGALQDWQANKAQRDAGRAETAAAINKETADAERRAGQAGTNAARGRDLDDGLASGRVDF